MAERRRLTGIAWKDDFNLNIDLPCNAGRTAMRNELCKKIAKVAFIFIVPCTAFK